MALPTPPLRFPQKWVFTHAVFSSQYTYVRNLNFWHTKTEKQIQDEPMVAKRPSQNQAQKNKPFFPTESPSERR